MSAETIKPLTPAERALAAIAATWDAWPGLREDEGPAVMAMRDVGELMKRHGLAVFDVATHFTDAGRNLVVRWQAERECDLVARAKAAAWAYAKSTPETCNALGAENEAAWRDVVRVVDASRPAPGLAGAASEARPAVECTAHAEEPGEAESPARDAFRTLLRDLDGRAARAVDRPEEYDPAACYAYAADGIRRALGIDPLRPEHAPTVDGMARAARENSVSARRYERAYLDALGKDPDDASRGEASVAREVALASLDRESLGRLVREEWVSWAREQANPKASWLAPWEALSEPEREVDRRIGERLFAKGKAAQRFCEECHRSVGAVAHVDCEAPALGLVGEELGYQPGSLDRAVETMGKAVAARTDNPPREGLRYSEAWHKERERRDEEKRRDEVGDGQRIALLDGYRALTIAEPADWPLSRFVSGHVQRLTSGAWEWCHDGGFDSNVVTLPANVSTFLSRAQGVLGIAPDAVERCCEVFAAITEAQRGDGQSFWYGADDTQRAETRETVEYLLSDNSLAAWADPKRATNLRRVLRIVAVDSPLTEAEPWERLRSAATAAVEVYENSDADETFDTVFDALGDALAGLTTIEKDVASRGHIPADVRPPAPYPERTGEGVCPGSNVAVIGIRGWAQCPAFPCSRDWIGLEARPDGMYPIPPHARARGPATLTKEDTEKQLAALGLHARDIDGCLRDPRGNLGNAAYLRRGVAPALRAYVAHLDALPSLTAEERDLALAGPRLPSLFHSIARLTREWTPRHALYALTEIERRLGTLERQLTIPSDYADRRDKGEGGHGMAEPWRPTVGARVVTASAGPPPDDEPESPLEPAAEEAANGELRTIAARWAKDRFDRSLVLEEVWEEIPEERKDRLVSLMYAFVTEAAKGADLRSVATVGSRVKAAGMGES